MNAEFEKKLQRQTLRRIPGEWREEILQAARATDTRRSVSEPQLSWLSKLLWPCPQAWAGLAGAWVLIIVLNVSTGNERARAVVSQTARPPAELINAAREQRRELARLLEPTAPTAIDRPKSFPPRPRSDWRGEILNA
jgi:hypothetical protein